MALNFKAELNVGNRLCRSRKRQGREAGQHLRGDADGAGVGVALAHHDAAHGDKGRRRKAKLLRAQQRGDRQIAPRAQLPVGLQHRAPAQVVRDQHLVRLCKAQLPGQPCSAATSLSFLRIGLCACSPSAQHQESSSPARLEPPQLEPSSHDVCLAINQSLHMHAMLKDTLAPSTRRLKMCQARREGALPADLMLDHLAAPVPPSWPEMSTWSAWPFTTPAATTPTPFSETSFTLTRAPGLEDLRS